jgi:hypothetical protein
MRKNLKNGYWSSKSVSATLESYFIMQKSRTTELLFYIWGEGEKVGIFHQLSAGPE